MTASAATEFRCQERFRHVSLRETSPIIHGGFAMLFCSNSELHTNWVRVSIATLVAGWLVGCAGATPNYPGPRRAPSEVAIISSDVRVKIVKIDGRKVNGGTFEVLPSEHQIHTRITFLGDEILNGMKGMRRTCYADAKFIADAGQEYRIMRVSKKGKVRNVPGGLNYQHDWGVYLQNQTSGESLPDAMSEMSCGS
jgi:hypothetical protein